MTQIFNKDQVEEAAALLKKGGVVAFPTETVYGLGASLFQPLAIAQIFKVKGRPQDNPLIAHVSGLEQVEEIADQIPPVFYTLADRFFPGPLTVVLKKNKCVPSVVSAGLDSIAIRMPSHPIARNLIIALQEPIVAPSANISGTPSSTRFEHVMEDFKGKISAIIDGGATHYGIESTVISLIGNQCKLLRPGAIRIEELEEVIGESLALPSFTDLESPMAPGMKYRHYAPKTEILIFQKEEALQEALSKEPYRFRMVLSREKLSFAIPEKSHHFFLNAPDFYFLLRQADALSYEQIVIFCDEKTLFDLALMNRILKSASCL